ncbi:fungal tRNA ligase phosphodiesterase domain-containing protein [Diplogelasinospora grovesii]|uniref:Fungal tRNA ligase phosphodiesterase domain-containing protein n=1 Tax=Diplogelasinospora grovesii TaxID=303347 RepID=A0AAN6N6T7_9PEZI|nr:fungal tRNA ligase phosphodiesterase domain-containing protein [Diplogelasinospora grovesii]
MLSFPSPSTYQAQKCFVTYGVMGHLDPKQPPSKGKPWTTLTGQDFIYRADLILPQEAFEAVQAQLVQNRPAPGFKRVIMSLHDILSGPFFTEYIKKGDILMLSEGRRGIDNVFSLKGGLLTMFLDKESYERAGLVGKPDGVKGKRNLKPRWVVEFDLTSPSMFPGKKGFDRLIYASKNALSSPITWLFSNLSATIIPSSFLSVASRPSSSTKSLAASTVSTTKSAVSPSSSLRDAAGMEVPYVSQDVQENTDLIRALENATSGKKGGIRVKKTRFDVADSPNRIQVDSWRFQDFDYKKRDLPTYARGLFTTRTENGTQEIAVRGYDKFFNVGEVYETRWENIKTRTKGPYELTLKENGCIIFVSGLEDGTLLVCSKHSTGDRSDVNVSHASAGEQRLERQLERMGKTRQDLAQELRKRNVTAVAELCDDTFEEHILAYGPDKAGLYLHGMNLNVPQFVTYSSPLVQRFADDWGFVKVGLMVMDTIDEVKAFLEACAETGAHDGRDIEGFVIRCKMSYDPTKMPYEDWFFKFKFEEPYLMYRQWRECTKALISGKPPKFKKHAKITEEYLQYARQRLAADRNLGKLYNQNHGIIALRNDFLEFKHLKGSDAANFEQLYGGGDKAEVTRDIILVPIATIGCGKTTIALALTHLFGWGHIQNDNIAGAKRPPRFTKALLTELDERPAVFADRNNAQRREREQLITDVKMQHINARLVALHFVHDRIDDIRRVTQERVFDRGDNHQTIQAATDMGKVRGIMEGFINRFEPCDPEKSPDNGFDAVISLDPAKASRENLEIVVKELHRLYPKFVATVPSAEEMDSAIQVALEGYKPDLRHTIPDRTSKNKKSQNKDQPAKQQKKKQLEYMSVDVPTKDVLNALEKTFAAAGPEQSRFFKQLQGQRRVQPHFHVTLMHRASANDHPELWARYMFAHDTQGAVHADGRLDDLGVQLERVVYDDRLMAIVVRLVPSKDTSEWQCVNRVAHITVGTRDESVKPKESNDLLARWLGQGSGPETKIGELLIDGKPVLKGVVKGVLSR